jgi:hypothetical protein
VRLIGIAAVELLVIDGLDLLTALSTMPYLHSTTGWVHAVSVARAHPNFFEEWCETPLAGYCSASTRSVTGARI